MCGVHAEDSYYMEMYYFWVANVSKFSCWSADWQRCTADEHKGTVGSRVFRCIPVHTVRKAGVKRFKRIISRFIINLQKAKKKWIQICQLFPVSSHLTFSEEERRIK